MYGRLSNVDFNSPFLDYETQDLLYSCIGYALRFALPCAALKSVHLSVSPSLAQRLSSTILPPFS